MVEEIVAWFLGVCISWIWIWILVTDVLKHLSAKHIDDNRYRELIARIEKTPDVSALQTKVAELHAAVQSIKLRKG